MRSTYCPGVCTKTRYLLSSLNLVNPPTSLIHHKTVSFQIVADKTVSLYIPEEIAGICEEIGLHIHVYICALQFCLPAHHCSSNTQYMGKLFMQFTYTSIFILISPHTTLITQSKTN